MAAPSCLAAVTPWVDFELTRGHLHIDAVIDGYKTTAILDSGASVNGISETYIREFGRGLDQGSPRDKIQITGVSGTVEKRLLFGVPVQVFGAEFEFDGLVTVDIANADLLLGLDFFQRAIVQIDYPNERLRLIERESLKLRKLANVKMRRADRSRLTEIKLRLNDQANVWVVLDTGNAGGLLLPRRTAERYGWLDRYPRVTRKMVGVHGRPIVTESFNLPTLKIGPYTLENVVVTVPGEGERMAVKNGLVGYDILRHFQLTMDLKKRRMHIEAVDVLETGN